MAKRILCLIVLVACAGCAEIVTHRADFSKEPDGIRVYAPRVLLVVDEKKGSSKLIYVPDYKNGYDIKPRTILSKQNFEVDVSDGMLTKVSSNNDTSGFLSFLQSMAQTASKAAGLPVSSEGIEGTLGLPSGIYELGNDGRFHRMNVE